MYKIGEFSKLSFVTIQALRHYDEKGLLKPAMTHESSGYRYYTASQLPKINLIVALKNAGLSLDEIGEIVGDGLDLTQVAKVLQRKRSEMQHGLEEWRKKLSLLEQTLIQVEGKGSLPPYSVVIKKTPPTLVASLREVLPDFSGPRIAQMFSQLVGFIQSNECGFAGPTSMAYHDDDYKEQNCDIEVSAPIVKRVSSDTKVSVRELPSIEMAASLTYLGPYEKMADAYRFIMSWIVNNHYSISGICREHYLVSPVDTSDPNQYVSEIQIPISPLK